MMPRWTDITKSVPRLPADDHPRCLDNRAGRAQRSLERERVHAGIGIDVSKPTIRRACENTVYVLFGMDPDEVLSICQRRFAVQEKIENAKRFQLILDGGNPLRGFRMAVNHLMLCASRVRNRLRQAPMKPEILLSFYKKRLMQNVTAIWRPMKNTVKKWTTSI